MNLRHAAAGNNADWCAAVLAACGIASARSGALWAALGPPPLYPGLVTLREGCQVAVEAALAGPVPPDAIKDSFADLDLTAQGFDCAIKGAWLLAPKAVPVANPALPVADDAGFARWNRGWLGDQPDLPGITPFPPVILTNPDIRFALVARTDGELAGAAFNLGHGICGLSNVFGGAPDVLPALIHLAQGLWPGLPVVMWDSDSALTAALDAGFTRIGPMQVWLRKPADSGAPAGPCPLTLAAP